MSQRFRLPDWLACLTTMLVSIVFAVAQPARAESPAARELATAAGPGIETTNVELTGAGQGDKSHSSVVDLRDLGLRMSNQLNENAWDFTDPDSIPGFASQPYQLHSVQK